MNITENNPYYELKEWEKAKVIAPFLFKEGFVVLLQNLFYLEEYLLVKIGIMEAQEITLFSNMRYIDAYSTYNAFFSILKDQNTKCDLVYLEKDANEMLAHARILFTDKVKWYDLKAGDAINLALRFHALVYVDKKLFVSEKSDEVLSLIDRLKKQDRNPESHLLYEYQNKFKMAISEERYEDASQLKEKIDRLYAKKSFTKASKTKD